MHVREYGDGPSAVIVLHATPGTSSDFVPFAQALGTSHRVLVPDLPGYGPSAPIDPYDWDAAQRAIERMLRSRGIEQIAAVGHSSGCYRAFRLALEDAIHVTRIACLGATAGPAEAGRKSLREAAGALRGGRDLGSMFVMRFLSERSRADARMVEGVENWLKAAPREVIAAELETFAGLDHLGPRLAAIRAPTLFRVGELDVATPPAISEALAREIPSARVEIVAGAGHALLLEDSAATIESLRSFLDPAAR
jgi:3-oxoadipate enol-lactonase